MNKLLKKMGMMMAMGAIVSLGASCSDDHENVGEDNGLTVNEQRMEAIASQYVSNTIYKTYGAIADATDRLYSSLADATARFKADPASVNQSDIDNICQIFLEIGRAHV